MVGARRIPKRTYFFTSKETTSLSIIVTMPTWPFGTTTDDKTSKATPKPRDNGPGNSSDWEQVISWDYTVDGSVRSGVPVSRFLLSLE